MVTSHFKVFTSRPHSTNAIVFCVKIVVIIIIRTLVLFYKMAKKLSKQEILELLENGEVSELDISDDEDVVENVEEDNEVDAEDDNFPIEELDCLLDEFEGNFDDDFMEIDDTFINAPRIPSPNNAMPITQKYKMVTTTISTSNHSATRPGNSWSGGFFT